MFSYDRITCVIAWITAYIYILRFIPFQCPVGRSGVEVAFRASVILEFTISIRKCSSWTENSRRFLRTLASQFSRWVRVPLRLPVRANQPRFYSASLHFTCRFRDSTRLSTRIIRALLIQLSFLEALCVELLKISAANNTSEINKRNDTHDTSHKMCPWDFIIVELFVFKEAFIEFFFFPFNSVSEFSLNRRKWKSAFSKFAFNIPFFLFVKCFKAGFC